MNFRSVTDRGAPAGIAVAMASCAAWSSVQPMTANVLANHRRIAPFGLAGGADGAPGRNSVRRRGAARSEELAATFGLAVEPGDEIQIETPGGGGFGAQGL